MASVELSKRPNAVHLVSLAGEFDVAQVQDVAAGLDEAIADPETRTVAVDLSEVTFLDSTMLHKLFRDFGSLEELETYAAATVSTLRG